MSRKWIFRPDEWESPTINGMEWVWKNVPNAVIRKTIAVQAQYLEHHLTILDRLRHHDPNKPGYRFPLALSLRGSTVHHAITVYASIAECVLCAHGKKRKWKGLGPRPTFGESIGALREAKDPDLFPLMKDLEQLNEWRNDIHLYRLAERKQQWDEWEKKERRMRKVAMRVLEKLTVIKSPYKPK